MLVAESLPWQIWEDRELTTLKHFCFTLYHEACASFAFLSADLTDLMSFGSSTLNDIEPLF